MKSNEQRDITSLLKEWQGGSAEAADQLVSKTYDELRRVARAHMRRERMGHTLQPTALLNEAYLRLLRDAPESADSREAFFRIMSAEMRRRLIDHARRRLADKRGGGIRPVPLESFDVAAPADGAGSEEMLDRLDAALARLRELHPRTASVVELRFIAGLTTEETAEELGLSTGTVKRDWVFAKAWLAAALDGEPDTSVPPSR
jgi:RNA polymerase sigma factor (TIGR02999 family)